MQRIIENYFAFPSLRYLAVK